jgi:hypothetical protein
VFTKNEHLDKAKANERFAASLDMSDPVHAEWDLTVIFYVAVHIVQAYFSTLGLSYTTHTNRASAIYKDKKIRGVYDDYRELENMSREARYECSHFDAGHVTYAMQCLANVRQRVETFL